MALHGPILGNYARIVRFDHSSIFATTKFNYKTDTNKLNEFLWCYSHQSPAQRGHDPTATRIERGDRLWDIITKTRGSDLEAHDYVQRLFDDSLDEAWPWWQLEVPVSPPSDSDKPCTHSHSMSRKFLVGKHQETRLALSRICGTERSGRAIEIPPL